MYDDDYDLEPLTDENIEDEITLLIEDILNWDCGHTLGTLGITAEIDEA